MADLKITQLPDLLGTDLKEEDKLAVADVSARETRKISPKDFLENGLANVVADGKIPGAKLIPDSVTANEIAPGAITDSELANGSVDTGALQNAAVTNNKLASGIDGAKLTDATVTAAKIPAASFDRGLDKASGAIGHTNAVTAATQNGITFDAQGHITATAPLIDADLPVASALTIGAVSIPNDSGLTVTGAGALDHENNIAAGSVAGVTYDEHGHITSVRNLIPADLPTATATEIGAVMVPGPALEITSDGKITHTDSIVAPGTYPKVTVDQQGHVTAGTVLAGTDIPGIDASKIVSGRIGGDRIADGAISRINLANYSISFIQEAEPIATDVPIGTFWYQESTSFLHQWNGNSWMGIGIGRLSQENMRFCGVINADTGLITGVTPFGTAAGYAIGDVLRAASDSQTGVYFVTELNVNGGAIQTFTAPAGPTSGPYAKVSAVGGSGKTAQFQIAANGTITMVSPGFGYKDGDIVSLLGSAIGGSSPTNDISITINTTSPITGPIPAQGRNINVNSVKGIAFDSGDWVICNGAAAGWDRIDLATVLGGTGGGGGAQLLNDLLDVDTTTTTPNDKADLFLVRNGTTTDWHGTNVVYGGQY